MKRRGAVCLLLLALLLPANLAALDYDLGFSPSGTALQAVVRAIGSAQHTIVVAAYEFTSDEVAQALVDAAARGIKVWIVLDDKAAHEKASKAAWVSERGVQVRTDRRYAILHHKFLVVDRTTVETGSFNYTASANKRNAENALVLYNVPELADRYLTEWTRLWDESQTLTLGSQGRLK